MAVSVRIEDEAFSDVRFTHLGSLLEPEDHRRQAALGLMADLWRQCTLENSYVLPLAVVAALVDPQLLIDARLAEKVRGGLRIRGTEGRIEWLQRLRTNAKKGGEANKANWKAKRKPTGQPNGYGLREPDASPPVTAPATTKKNTRTFHPSAERVADYLRHKAIKRQPTHRLASEANWKKTRPSWLLASDRMIRIDGRDPYEAKKLIDYLMTPDCMFVVDSVKSLRKKWDHIVLAMQREHPQPVEEHLEPAGRGIGER